MTEGMGQSMLPPRPQFPPAVRGAVAVGPPDNIGDFPAWFDGFVAAASIHEMTREQWNILVTAVRQYIDSSAPAQAANWRAIGRSEGITAVLKHPASYRVDSEGAPLNG